MSNERIRERMEQEARNWMEREAARIAMLDAEKRDRREHKEALATLVIGSLFSMLALAFLLYIAAGGGR